MKSYNLFLPFIYMYVIFPFVTKTFPTIQFSLLYFFIGFYILFHLRDVKILLFDLFKNKKTLRFILTLYLSICFFSLLSPCVHETGDISYFISIILGIIRNFLKIFFLLLITFRCVKNKNILLEEFLKNIVYSMILYIFSTMIFIFSPNTKLLWRSIIYEPIGDRNSIEQLNYFTRYGISGFSGFKYTFQCSICYIFNLVFICMNNKAKKSNMINWLNAIILLLGNSFYGRAGLMVSIAVTMLYIGYDIFFYKNYKFFIYISVALVGIFLLFGLFRTNRAFDLWYRWSMAPVENFMVKGKIGTNSSDDMFEKMSFWPGWKTFILGDGYWVDPNGKGYYRKTDLGYMRPMLFYGIFPQLLAYLIPLIILLKIFLYGKYYRLMAILLAIQLFLFELKGEVFYIQTGLFMCCLVSIACKDYKQFE